MDASSHERLAELLQLASDAHEGVFHFTHGEDADWATFYADFLVNHTPLDEVLGTMPVRSHVTAALFDLDRRYTDEQPAEPWTAYYATGLLERFGG